MLDAYTVRKAVPRILLAAIGINLSIYICVAMIDLTNILGSGFADLLLQPFKNSGAFGNASLDSNLGGVLLVTGMLATGGAIWLTVATTVVGFGLLAILLPLVISMALISLTILFTLVIRQALIIFLTIVSPVAIAFSVLPGTEKYFKKWLDLFIKTLMVYPIVAIMFAVSSAMVSILVGSAAADPEAIGMTKAIAAVVVAFLPLVLIPFAFKLAGGAISAVMNAGAGGTRGFVNRFRENYDKSRRDPNTFIGGREYDAKNRRVHRRAQNYNRAVTDMNGGGISRRTAPVRKFIAGKRSAPLQSQQNAIFDKLVQETAATGNDGYGRASVIEPDRLRGSDRHRIDKNGVEQFMLPTGAWVSKAEIDAAKQQYSNPSYRAAWMRHVMAKTENVPPENQDMIMQDFLNYANATGMEVGQANGDWQGIAIPNQRMRADLRYRSIERDSNGQLVSKSKDEGLLDFFAGNQGMALAYQNEATFQSAAEAYNRQTQRTGALKTAVDTATNDQDRQIKQREYDQHLDRLHNSKENIRKFVADPTKNMTEQQKALYRQMQQASEKKDGAESVGQSGYGAASSASYKVEEAAKKALTAIDGYDRLYGTPPPARLYNGGKQGDQPRAEQLGSQTKNYSNDKDRSDNTAWYPPGKPKPKK